MYPQYTPFSRPLLPLRAFSLTRYYNAVWHKRQTAKHRFLWRHRTTSKSVTGNLLSEEPRDHFAYLSASGRVISTGDQGLAYPKSFSYEVALKFQIILKYSQHVLSEVLVWKLVFYASWRRPRHQRWRVVNCLSVSYHRACWALTAKEDTWSCGYSLYRDYKLTLTMISSLAWMNGMFNVRQLELWYIIKLF